ncbi:MAG TPA: complex I NDUFA9 subunit family protein [Dehalococcoidia bacterium]
MILVAGGTGFVGGGIVRELARRGKQFAVLTRVPDRSADRFPGLDVQYRQGDVREPSSLAAAMAGVESVIGCQQFPNSPIENPKRGHTFEEVDARGTENLVTVAKAAGAKQFVYLSAAGAAPEGRHWFRAKWRAEQAVRNSGLTYTILRPPWVYGPEDGALNRFLAMSRFQPFVPLIGSPGKQMMQPVFIDDVGRATAECLDNPAAAGQTFEVGGPDVFTMSEVVRTALGVTGRRRFLLPAPKFVMKALASVLQFAPGRPLTPDAVDFITMDALGDPAEISAKLGLTPTPLRDGLATYLAKHD